MKDKHGTIIKEGDIIMGRNGKLVGKVFRYDDDTPLMVRFRSGSNENWYWKLFLFLYPVPRVYLLSTTLTHNMEICVADLDDAIKHLNERRELLEKAIKDIRELKEEL